MQSAYRKFHSTETAATQVFNDLLLAADGGKNVSLVRCALSTLPPPLILWTTNCCYFGWSYSSGYMVSYWTGLGRACQAERSMLCLAAANHVLFTFSARCLKVQCWVRCCSLCTRPILRTLWTSMVYFTCVCRRHADVFALSSQRPAVCCRSAGTVYFRGWPVDGRQSPQTQHRQD